MLKSNNGMKMNDLKITAGLAFLSLAALAASCRTQDPQGAVFRTAERPFGEACTRSLLTAPDIETKKTGVTLAAYKAGTLAACAHFASGFDAMTLPLEPGKSYKVNMDLVSYIQIAEDPMQTFVPVE